MQLKEGQFPNNGGDLTKSNPNLLPRCVSGLLLLNLHYLYQKLNIDTNWWWLGAGLMGVVMVGCWFNGISIRMRKKKDMKRKKKLKVKN